MKWLSKFLFLLGWVHLSYAIACKEPCDSEIFGYRRAFVSEPQIKITESKVYTYHAYYKQLEIQARELRSKLIRTGALGKKKDPESEGEGKNHNIASFAFVFFDLEGNQINENPFHFSPQATSERLMTPFFFLSGRRNRDYDPQSDGDFGWTALPNWAPSVNDVVLFPPKLDKSLDLKTFQVKISKDYDTITPNLIAQADLAAQAYRKCIEILLLNKSLHEDFF